jgi:chemotaxis protein methyltransferase CheR
MTISSADFEFVRRLAQSVAGFLLEDGKEYLVETRLGPIAKAEGLVTVTDLVSKLRWQSPPALVEKVVEALTTNETLFFRDARPFEHMKRDVFPDLFARNLGQPVRVWSAASSTGQEPYSIAMLLVEHFPLQASLVSILGTDLSNEVLERARTAQFYESEMARGLTPEQRRRFFEPVGNEWRLVPRIREMVEFRQLNLAVPFQNLPLFDVILLRNVLIYFDLAGKKSVLSRIKGVLKPGGYLLLGSSETLLGVDDDFVAQRDSGTTSYRYGDPVGSPSNAMSSTHMRSAAPALASTPPAAPPGAKAGAGASVAPRSPAAPPPPAPKKSKSLPPQVAKLKDLQWPEWKRDDKDPKK